MIKDSKSIFLISWYLVNLLLIYHEEMVRWGSGEKPQSYRLRCKLEEKTGQSFCEVSLFLRVSADCSGPRDQKAS